MSEEKKAAIILLVEDDEAILRGLQMNLEGEGYHVVLARNGEAALELATAQTPDLVLLDVMLPGLNGYEVLAEIRRRQPRLPVVMLTAKGTEQDKVMGLDLGADDYIVKPFSLRELLSRVKAQLRRALGEPAQVMRFGDVEVNFTSREVRRAGEAVVVSPSEFALLKALLDRPGRALSRDELISVAWDDDYEGTDRTIDNFIVKLRQKLDDVKEPRHFLTVRGLGYRFAP